MRKVHREMIAAMKEGRDATNAAHNVRSYGGISVYRLHGNKIAEWSRGTLELSNAGWDTPTTRAALSAVSWALAGVRYELNENGRQVIHVADSGNAPTLSVGDSGLAPTIGG